MGLVIGIIILIFTFTNSSFYIEKQNWKYEKGAHIGDWLEKSSFKIDNGIIKTNTGEAKVIFCYAKGLVVENLKTNEKGFYVNKN